MRQSATAPEMLATTLLDSSIAWNGDSYSPHLLREPRFTLMKVAMGPHVTSSWHRHHVVLVGYVLAGTVTLATTGGLSRTFYAGQGIPETVGVIHRAKAGGSGVELLVFSAGSAEHIITELLNDL